MRFEKALWDAINDYAISIGGDPSKRVYGNTARMDAVATVGRIVDQAACRRQIDDLTVEELRKGSNAAAAAACKLTSDYTHLQRLYTESRDYVRALEGERDALALASRRDVAEINRLDAEVTALRQKAGHP